MQPQTNPKPGNTRNGASRRVDEVIDPYGALRIVVLRDGRMGDAKLVPWESCATAGGVFHCRGAKNTGTICRSFRCFLRFYLAYSTALVSRMTLILIWPGYSSSDSIFLARSRARRIIFSSVTSSGLTITRTSRPAWMA